MDKLSKAFQAGFQKEAQGEDAGAFAAMSVPATAGGSLLGGHLATPAGTPLDEMGNVERSAAGVTDDVSLKGARGSALGAAGTAGLLAGGSMLTDYAGYTDVW